MEKGAMENLIGQMMVLLISKNEFKLNVNGENPKSGYMVLIETENITLDCGSSTLSTIHKLLKDYIESNIVLLTTGGNYLGAWKHKGNLYLDISKRCESYAAALNQAARLNQAQRLDLARVYQLN